jgi:hypothetical protein
MNWKGWVAWKEKKYITVVLFIIVYILTIPIRNYSFLEGFFDITQGVPILAHLTVIIIASIIILIGLWIIEIIIKEFVLK